MFVADITAYCLPGKTAMGTKPHVRMCAGPRSLLGTEITVNGKRYLVEDVHPGGGIDLWLPTRKACRRFGRRRGGQRVYAAGVKSKCGICKRKEQTP